MKKTYIAPAVELIDVQTESLMLTGSYEVDPNNSVEDESGWYAKEHVFEVDVWGLDEEGYE